MFFKVELLCRGGRFATIWVAATRGIRAVSNADMKNVNIIHDCEVLLKFIISNSNMPNQRFSLALSSKLIHGTCLLYRKQVDQLYNNILMLMAHTPSKILSILDDVDSPMPHVQKRKSVIKKSAQVFSNDTDLALLGEAVGDNLKTADLEAELQSRILNQANITMVEVDDSHIPPTVDEWETSDFGDGMDMGFFDDFMHTVDIEGNIVPLQKELPMPDPQDLDAIEIFKVPAVPDVTPEPFELKPTAHVEPEDPIQYNDVPPTRANKFPTKEHRREIKSEATIKVVHRSNIEIDRTGDDEIAQEFDITHELLQTICAMKIDKYCGFNLNLEMVDGFSNKPRIHLFAKPRKGPQPQDQPMDLDEVPTPFGPNIIRRSSSVQSLPTISLDSERAVPVSAARTLRDISLTEATPMVQELMPPPMVQELMLPPTPTRISTPMRSPRELESKTLGPDFSMVSIEKASDITTTSLEVQEMLSDEERLRNMVSSLKEFHTQGKMPLTLEDIAQKPLTKKSIAMAYSSLLSLCKMEYIELKTIGDSLEFSHIEAGPKLRNI